jgi:hypothetical protein
MIRHDRLSADGEVLESTVIDLDAGTITFEVEGKVVESRQLTDDEVALNTPPPPSEADRLAALEATNAELLAALARVTSLAQIRAAAVGLA